MIKKFYIAIAAAIVLAIAFPGGAAADSEYLKGLEGKELPKMTVPSVDKVVLPNGMTCFIKEDRSLPIIQIQVTIYEPADKLGLASITGSAVRSAGAGELSPEDLDLLIDSMGAELSSSIGTESGSVYLAILSEDMEKGVGLLSDLLFKPRFDKGRVAIARHKLAESLRRDKDEPNLFASILFSQLVYGKNSPWARRPDPDLLTSIGEEDIKNFHASYFVPSNMILAAAGDFKTRDLVEQLKKYFPKESGKKVEFPNVPELKPSFLPDLRVVKGPKTQTFIRMGHLGVKRHNPDWYSIYLLSQVLGSSGFKSRLVEEIRVKRGMAYSVSGGISQATDYGLFTVKMSTSADNAYAAINLAKEQIKKLSKHGEISDEELDLAKRSLLASSIFELDGSFKIVSDRARFMFYGYPSNYWIKAYEGIARVSKDDVEDAASKYLHPDGIKILMLGPTEE